jgi:hypothetical protein
MDINYTWGPDTWKGINAIVRFYPETPTQTERDDYRRYLESLKFVLPCDKCKKHYTEYLDNIDWEEITTNRFTMTKAVIDLHNSINKRNNKRELDYPEAMYIINMGHPPKSNINIYIAIILSIAVLILIITR